MPQPWLYNGLMVGGGAAAEPSTIAALTDGQLAVGKTGYAPVPATPTGAGGMVVTGGAGTLTLTTRGYVSSTSIGNVDAGEDTLHTWAAPANTVIADSGVHVSTALIFAANANTKTVKFYAGGSAITINPTTTAPNGIGIMVDLWLYYLTSTSAQAYLQVSRSTPALEVVSMPSLSTTIDWTGIVTLKFTGEATATNDIIQLATSMRAFRTP